MSDTKRDLLAGEYVLGTLDSEARARFSAQLEHDESLQAAVEAWQRRLAGLGSGTAPVDPPPGLWDRIEAVLDEPAPEVSPSAGELLTVRGEEGDWLPLTAGIEKKQLHADREAGVECYLLRLAPGARLPGHDHKMVEECVMLEGEMWIGDLKLVAGDFHLAPPDSVHPEIHSVTGATAFIRGEIHDLAV